VATLTTKQRRRIEGLCTDCGVPSPDRRRCPACSEKNQLWCQARRERDPEYLARRRKREEMGGLKAHEYRKLHPVTPPLEKRCGTCRLVKPASEFGVRALAYDGLNGYCNECCRARAKVNNDRRISEAWVRTLVAYAKARAKRYGYTFELTEDDVIKIFDAQAGCCYWYGVSLVPSAVKFHPRKPSLDKIDPSGGYTRDNTVLSCLAANLGRNRVDPVIFRQFCDLLRST
jgi:hypothetical protein